MYKNVTLAFFLCIFGRTGSCAEIEVMELDVNINGDLVISGFVWDPGVSSIIAADKSQRGGQGQSSTSSGSLERYEDDYGEYATFEVTVRMSDFDIGHEFRITLRYMEAPQLYISSELDIVYNGLWVDEYYDDEYYDDGYYDDGYYDDGYYDDGYYDDGYDDDGY